jgi:DNA-directed RNA polymerase specialized sigma24 family protein
MRRVELDGEQLELIADWADVQLRDALASLEPFQREAVIRRVVLEESYRAIAADLRCSEQVVRKMSYPGCDPEGHVRPHPHSPV